MPTRDKAAGTTTTIRTLSATAAWVGGVVPVAGDDARWIAGSSSGSHTGSITCDRIIIEGASGDITYASGTVTFVSTGDFFRNLNNNNNRLTVTGGTFALGAANRSVNLYSSTGSYTLQLFGANAITGAAAAVLNVINTVNNSAYNCYLVVSNVQNSFLGTVRLTDNSGIFTESTGTATSAFNAATIVCDGAGWLIGPATGSCFIGNATKNLTINFDGRLGYPGRSLTVLSAVQLAGTGTRTLTVEGVTMLGGPVTGSQGVTAAIQNSTGSRAGAITNTNIQLIGASNGLSGPCSVSGGRFVVNPATTAERYQPSSLTVASDATFEYFSMSNTAFTFPCAPSGQGFVAILGNHASGGGVTFSAGQLSSFAGVVRAFPLPDTGYQAARIRLSELPLGGLDWFASPSNGNAMTGEITYLGTAATYAAKLTLDSQVNTSQPGLTGGVYSLIVPAASGAINITGTVQRLNTAGTASARMNLTLGGDNLGNNTLSGVISEVASPLNGAILGITKVDAGRWVLSGNSSHTGIHTISAGTLSAQSATALGSATSAGGVTVSGTGKLELSGGITLNKSATPFTIHSSSPITSIGDNTLQTAGITLGGTTTFEVTTGNRLAIVNSGAITDGATTYGLTKTGAGELSLAAFANTYDGTVTVSAGTLAFGSSGSLGTGNVQVAGNLKYTGTGETYSRSTQLTGSTPSLEAAGSGTLIVTNLSQDTSAKTLTLKGTNASANKVTTALANNTGTLSLTKADVGQWVLTGVLSYGGATAVDGGTLRVETTNSNTTSGAVTIDASGTVELITDAVVSTAGNGRVLGTSAVTCNGGTIKTRGGVTQKGQVRYGGNLTFGTGSTLYIGAAA